VFALSVNVLDRLFCRGFDDARRRFAPVAAKFDLAAGNVEARVATAGP
jgi:hypothetical protein